MPSKNFQKKFLTDFSDVILRIKNIVTQNQKDTISEQKIYDLIISLIIAQFSYRNFITKFSFNFAVPKQFSSFFESKENFQLLQQIITTINDNTACNFLAKFPKEFFSNEILKTEFLYELLEFFTTYNWINSTERHDSFITPRILGTIFESYYLPKQKRKTTEKSNNYSLSERRIKGAYYTPSEIAHFISEQALLSSFFPEKNPNIHNLLEIMTSLSFLEKQSLEKKIWNIKLLDPACGAGEFLVICAHYLYQMIKKCNNNSSEKIPDSFIKRNILQKLIYGIDLNQDAIYLTKHRLWLWFMENIKSVNIKFNNLITHLPILDFNIKQGNSLIGFTTDFRKIFKKDSKKDFQQNNYQNLLQNKTPFQHSINLLEILKELSTNQKNITQQTISYFFKIYTDLIEKLKLITHENTSLLKEFSFLMKQNRNYLKIILNHYYLSSITKFKEKISLNNLKHSFHFCIDFYQILEEGGFDIIIGNPPYMEIKKFKQKKQKKILSEKYYAAYKLYDIAILFLERGINLLKSDGVLSYIITNKFLSTDYGKRIRKMILEKTDIVSILDVSYLPIFQDAAIYPIIITFSNNKSQKNTFYLTSKNVSLSQLKNKSHQYKEIKQEVYEKLPNNIFDITGKTDFLMKIISNPRTQFLESLGTFYYRLLGFTNWPEILEFISKKKNSEKDLRFIGTPNIKNYYLAYHKKITLKGQKIEDAFLQYQENFSKAWEIFLKNKLVVKEISKKLTISYDPGLFANITGVYMYVPHKIELIKPLLLVLNSKIINNFYSNLFSGTHLSGGYLRYNGSYLKQIPIILPKNSDYLTEMTKISNLILFLKQYQYLKNEQEDLKQISKISANLQNLANQIVELLYFPKNKSLDNIFQKTKKLPIIDFDYWFIMLLNNNNQYKEYQEKVINAILYHFKNHTL